MGRKIHGKRHRGVKDLEERQQILQDSAHHKVNHMPKDPEMQEIPRKVRDMMKLKAAVTSSVQVSRKKKNREKIPKLLDSSRLLEREVQLPGMKKPLKPVPLLKQMPGESEGKFMNRVNVATNLYLKQAQLEVKYKVAVVQDATTGKFRIQKEENGHPHKRKSKSMKRKLKLEQREEEYEEEQQQHWKKRRTVQDDDFAKFHDVVKFGEVVSAPPQLTARPRNAPERKKNRLNVCSSTDKAFDVPEIASSSLRVDRTVRRKLLPASDRRQLEAERERVQDAYRCLRAQKIRRKQ